MDYYIKIHPTCIAMLPENAAPRVFTSSDIYLNINNLIICVGGNPTTFVLEKPYISIGPAITPPAAATRVAQNIMVTQRAYGALIYALSTNFPQASIRELTSASVRQHLFPNTQSVSKDFLLTTVNAKYDTLKSGLTPIQELCVADCMLLSLFHESHKL